MTDYYGRGGGGNWDSAATWSLTSGGGATGSVPTASDNVFLDANSGNITINGASGTPNLCNNIDCTGYTGTLTHNTNGYLRINGDLTFSSGMTYTRGNVGNSTLELNGTGSRTINPAGKALARVSLINTGNYAFAAGASTGPINGSAAGTITLNGNLAFAGQSTWTAGTFDMNGYNITSGSQLNNNGATFLFNDFDIGNNPLTMSAGTITVTGNASFNRFLPSGSGAKTLNMGNGTWTLLNAGTVWTIGIATNLTVNAQGSTIEITNTSATGKVFNDTGKTFNIIYVHGASGAGTVTFQGSNTFAEMIFEPLASILFTNGTTTTITTPPAWLGTSGNLITIASSSGVANATVAVASGVVSCDYINLTRITASGATPFYAGANSTDGGNNTNWTFTAPPAGGVTGDLSATLGSLTVSSAAIAPVLAALSSTLGAMTLAAAAKDPVIANATPTLGALTSASTATVRVVANLAGTFGAMTMASASTDPVKADAAITLGAMTVVSAGSAPVVANASNTLGAMTLAATGVGSGVVANLSATLGALTASSSATVPVQANLDKTLGAMTMASVSTDPILANADITLGAMTSESTAKVDVKAAFNQTLGELTASATASVPENANLNVTLGAMTLVSSATTATFRRVVELQGYAKTHADLTGHAKTGAALSGYVKTGQNLIGFIAP